MGLSHSPRIVTDGLVLCLDAANPKSYPGSGTTWTDLSGNGKNGTLVNGVAYDSNNLGSLSFDQVDDRVTIESFSFSSSAISGSAWVYDTDTNGIARVIMRMAGSVLFRIDTNAEGGKLSSFVSIAGALEPRLMAAGTWNKNVWNNVAFTWNTDGRFRLFVNGSLQASSTTRTGTITSPGPATLFIGSETNGATMWKGLISNIMVYNVTLTDSEVQQNFNALRGRFGI